MCCMQVFQEQMFTHLVLDLVSGTRQWHELPPAAAQYLWLSIHSIYKNYCVVCMKCAIGGELHDLIETEAPFGTPCTLTAANLLHPTRIAPRLT